MEILIPLGFFVFLGAIILVPIWLRHRGRESGYKLIQEAMARGQQLDPRMIEDIVEVKRDRDGPRWRRSLGAGVVLGALAAGLAGLAWVDGDTDPSKAAVILGALAAGFITLALIDIFTTRKPADQ